MVTKPPATAKRQPAWTWCHCGNKTTVTRTPSPWEFDATCNSCGHRETISYAHHQPAPVFEEELKLPFDDEKDVAPS